MYVLLVALTGCGCPTATDGLEGDLGRIQEWSRREDGLVRARAASCGAQLVRRAARVCAAAAAAVGFRTKASGRRRCGGFPPGASRPLLAVCASSSTVTACAVTRRQARGALRAPLLLLGVPERAVMDFMGWSNAAMVKRYAHVTARLRRDIADRLNTFFWAPNETTNETESS